MKCSRLRLLLLLLWLSVAVFSGAQAQTEITIHQISSPQILYNWEKDKCESDFIPDAPARAFRRADGKIALIATHKENWMMTGENFKTLRPVCRSILRSSSAKNRDLGKLWIEATFTQNGKSIFALVSRDLSDQTKSLGCQTGTFPGQCWLNQIVTASSDNMGNTFTPNLNSDDKMESLRSDYKKVINQRYGVFTTSNIAYTNSKYYMIAYVDGGHGGVKGNCLFQTDDPFSNKWLAWNGSDFSAVSNPVSSGIAPNPTCSPVSPRILDREVRSISYLSKRHVWLAIFASRLKILGDKSPVPGFYYSVSKNLIDWGAPARIMEVPTLPRKDSMSEIMTYPSLLDPLSKSMNFDTIDHDQAILLFTHYHLHGGSGSNDRDLDFAKILIR